MILEANFRMAISSAHNETRFQNLDNLTDKEKYTHYSLQLLYEQVNTQF